MGNKYAYIPKTVILILLVAVFGLVTVVGCSKKGTDGRQKELVVLCGSSFVEPTEQLCSEFTARTDIKILTTVAGSEDFLPLVKAGQRGDIIVTHDPYLDYVK